MSKNLARISYVLALAGLKNGGSSSGGGSTGESETPYQYMLGKGYTGTETQFVNSWKASLNPIPFTDQLLSYLVSIGYNKDTLDQANTQILALVNGEIKPHDSFYDAMQKLVPGMSERDINTVMINLLTGKLTSKEMYKMLTDKGYMDTIENMQTTLYTLFTTEFVDKESIDTINNNINDLTEKVNDIEQNCVNPYEYAKTLDNSLEKSVFDKYYLTSVNGNSFYQYTQDIYPSLTKDQVNKKMIDLLSGKLDPVTAYEQAKDYGFTGTENDFANNFLDMANGLYLKESDLPEQVTPYTYLTDILGEGEEVTQEKFNEQYIKLAKGELDKQDIYNYLLAHGMDSSITQEIVDSWLIKLVSGDLNGQTPYEYAVNLGTTQTKEDFDYQFFTLLCKYLVDGGNGAGDSIGGATYPGAWVPDEQSTGGGKTLYQMYVDELGYEGTQEELYTQLEKIAYTLLVSGGDATDDMTHTGSNEFSDYIPPINDGNGNNVSLYSLFVEAGMDSNVINETDFNNKMITYAIKTSLPEILDGGNGVGDIGSNEFNSEIPNITPEIVQKSLYDLYSDIGLDKGYNKDEFNIKAIDLMQNAKLPYILSGGDSSNTDSWGSDEFSGEIPVIEPHECYVSELSGGNATGDEWGGEVFDGEYNGKPYVSDSLYATMVQQGYKYSQEQLSDQLNELMNYENPEVVVIDGGGSNKMDVEQEYNGALPEVRNAVLQYMVDELNFDPTPENVDNFNARFSEFANNGNLVGNVDGSYGS